MNKNVSKWNLAKAIMKPVRRVVEAVPLSAVVAGVAFGCAVQAVNAGITKNFLGIGVDLIAAAFFTKAAIVQRQVERGERASLIEPSPK